ncbi:uncharacterized protein LOC142976607 [Anticarsia gemmatalis]|uniref:uncharacterized protein LOC142976607 n=1 Tax=Anticarsia gemmatalis TaxID=129554 RepID=UPI003F774A4B
MCLFPTGVFQEPPPLRDCYPGLKNFSSTNLHGRSKTRVQCIFKRERPGPLSGLFIILNIQWCAVCPKFKSHVTPALPHRTFRFGFRRSMEAFGTWTMNKEFG